MTHKRRTNLVMVAALSCFLGPNAGAVEVSSFQAGNWVGGAYANEGTRQFSHCAVSADYRNDVSLIFGMDQERDLFLGLSHGGWSLVPGKAVNVGLMIDGAILGQFHGNPVDKILLFVDLSQAADIEHTIRKGSALRIAAAAENLYFDLNGLPKALDALRRCVDDNLSTASRSRPR